MDNSAPSAYTDRTPLAEDVNYAEFADVFSEILRRYPKNAFDYPLSNITEAGLLALRVFDGKKHTSEQDVEAFCGLYEATTKAMVELFEGQSPWMWVSVPWMREILEVNAGVMRPASFANFVQVGSTFNSKYVGSNKEYLAEKNFTTDSESETSDQVTANQGMQALVSHCFGRGRGDWVSLDQARSDEEGLLRLAGILNNLHDLKVVAPAYKKDLIVVGELLTLLSEASDRTQGTQANEILSKAASSLVDMAMSPQKSIGKIRENRFRPGYTSKNLAFWSTAAMANSLASVLPAICNRLPSEHSNPEVQGAIDRYRHQIGKDAFQALSNAIPYFENKGGKPFPAAYFKIALEVNGEIGDQAVESAYLSKLEAQELAELISSLSSTKHRIRLMKQRPDVKGDVLALDLGM